MTTMDSAAGDSGPSVPRPFGPRGRHRRPRPRKVLLAAGGLALAAGALSLVRLTPDPGGPGAATAEAEPRIDEGVTDRATNAAATVPDPPRPAGPSATAAMGGASATPTRGVTVVPRPTAAAPRPASSAPAPVATPLPKTPPAPAPTTTAPRPAATPTPTPTRSSAPAPTQSTPAQPGGGVCVPVIGLCVDPLRDRHDQDD
ncbi:hypothetical protein ACIPSE_06195 [Streptomyces sp. NPDC090106]|uniref:hypothetical protein n=1 Tax=Streptomyces sp. NPDC090106 TaxID=3365946 RepID=UPI00381B98AC